MDIFLKTVTYLPEEPDTGSSRDVPEEDIVITRDDSSMPGFVLEDLSAGQDVELKHSDIGDHDPV